MTTTKPKPTTSREQRHQQAESRLKAQQEKARQKQQRSQKPKPEPKPEKIKPSSLYSNNILVDDSNKPISFPPGKLSSIQLAEEAQALHDDLEGLNDTELEEKPPLTEKEKKFLWLYFHNGKLDAAVRGAGYKSKHQQSRSLIANRILKKYCEAVGDARNILRDLGASEAALLMLLWDKAQNARSEQVQVAAMKVLAQAFKMLGEGLELPKGASMRFYFEGQVGPDEAAEPYSREEGSQDQAAEPVTILK